MTERDRKKAAKKSALRIGGIITIVLMYLCGYAGGIMQDEHLETGQAMIMTMERISTFHLFFLKSTCIYRYASRYLYWSICYFLYA